jgi:hypothetical protein
MMRMWEHIHRGDIRNTIEWEWDFGFFFVYRSRGLYHLSSISISCLVTHISAEHDRDISHEGGRIARDIDDLTSPECENMRDRARMEPISWRIEDDGVRFAILRGKLFGKVLDFCIHEFDTCDTISVRIFDSIFTR